MSDSETVCVLLIEDSPADAFLLRANLSRLCPGKLKMLHTDRLSDAFPLLEKNSVELILTDLDLPDSTGTETVRALVERVDGVPVVVLTGHYDSELQRELDAAGAFGHLSKDSFNSPELGDMVNAALRHARGTGFRS